MQELLLGESAAPSVLLAYKKYASIFLQTANDTRDALAKRVNCSADAIPERYLASVVADEAADYAVLKNFGITNIIYGHTNSIVEVEGMNFIRANKKSFAFDPEVASVNPPQVLDTTIHEELQNERKKILSVINVNFVDFHF